VNAAAEPARETRSRVAVIGSGVAGLTTAHVIARSADVTLFEADHRLGGHADTHSVTASDGTELAIDTGFIVHNERTYPTLMRLSRELGVATQPSEMSMSVRDEVTGLVCRKLGLEEGMRLLDVGCGWGSLPPHDAEQYVEVLRSSVRPGGRVMVQQMSRPGGRHFGGGPFIESFIAPDMHMRPVG
jgi:hypothetical protein